jgi:hypothetical protein
LVGGVAVGDHLAAAAVASSDGLGEVAGEAAHGHAEVEDLRSGAHDQAAEHGHGQRAGGEVGVDGGAVDEVAALVPVVGVDGDSGRGGGGVVEPGEELFGDLFGHHEVDEGLGELGFGVAGRASGDEVGEGVGVALAGAAGVLAGGEVEVFFAEPFGFEVNGVDEGLAGDGVEAEGALDAAVGELPGAEVAPGALGAGFGAVGVGAVVPGLYDLVELAWVESGGEGDELGLLVGERGPVAVVQGVAHGVGVGG